MESLKVSPQLQRPTNGHNSLQRIRRIHSTGIHIYGTRITDQTVSIQDLIGPLTFQKTIYVSEKSDLKGISHLVLTGSSKIFQSIPSHSKPFHVWWMLTRRLSCPRPMSCISCQDDKAHEKLHPLMSSKTYIYRVITHFQAQDLLKHYTVAYHQKKTHFTLGTIRDVRILNPRSRLKKSNHTLPVTSYSLRLDQGTSRRYC